LGGNREIGRLRRASRQDDDCEKPQQPAYREKSSPPDSALHGRIRQRLASAALR